MSRWRILAVDDDPDILELIEMSLADTYDVLTVSTPSLALELVETFEPDLIILDIMMPKVTGYQLIETLRQRRDTARLPVIFLSAKDTIRDQKYGYKLGATTYLTKPFQPERLTRNIGNIFDHTPPGRHPKRWTLGEARERLRNLLAEQSAPPPTAPAKLQMPGMPKTVHHRENQAPDDSKWRL